MAFITNIDIYDVIDLSWDDPATPIETIQQPIAPVIAPNGWHWYPDANGNLFSLYFDGDGNECMVWMQNDDGSFYWRCANVGYNCRDIGVEDRKGIFFQDLLVGTMLLDEHLTVTWFPETYINHIDNIENINNIDDNIEINWLNNVNFNDIPSDDESDEAMYDP
jgi:hypothetical protein